MSRYVIENRRRATVLTLYWHPEWTREQIHEMSRNWARQASEHTHYLTEVRVQVVAGDKP